MAERAYRASSGASAASSTPSSGFPALDDLMEELQESGVASTAAPAKPAVVGRLRRDGRLPVTTPRTSIPPSVSTVAAPGSAVSTSSSLRGVRVQGHLEGERALMMFEEKNVFKFCRGYIGGRQGNRSRFCLKKIEDVLSFCCDGHKGDKFAISKSMLYIEMASDTALCQPCISKEQLGMAGMSQLLLESHSSRDWIKLVGTALDAFAASPSSKSESDPSASTSFKFEKEEVSPFKDPPVTTVKSELGSGAVELLKTYSGIQALKNLLPISTGLFDKTGSKAVEETVEFEADAPKPLDDRVEALGEIVHSMHETLPVGLEEVDNKFNKAVHMMEQRQIAFSASLDAIQQDLFGTEIPEDLLGSFPSIGRGLLDIAASVDTIDVRVQSVENVSDSIQNAFNPLVSRVDDAEADIVTLNSAIEASDTKMNALAGQFAESIRVAVRNLRASFGSASPKPASAPPQPASADRPFYAGYHDYKGKRSTIGLDNREYERLTRNGFILINTFNSMEEAQIWLSSLGVPNTPSTGGPAPSAVPPPQVQSVPLSVPSSELSILQQELNALRLELTDLRSAASNKGVSAGSYSFDSEEDLVLLIKTESVKVASALPCALDAMSFWAHRLSGVTSSTSQSTEKKLMMQAGISDTTSMSYIESFRREQPHFFLGNKDSNYLVPEGERFPMLASTAVWEGTTAISGYRRKYEKAVESGNQTALNYIGINTPMGSRFRELCIYLLQQTNTWLGQLEQHINNELKRVMQYGIPEERAYTLVSDEVNIIFKAIWEKRRLMQECTVDMDLNVFLARAVWSTIAAHMVMKEFSDAGFGVHTQISSLFTRFLAEETGSNFSSGLTSTITELKKSINEVKSSLESKAKAFNKRADSLTDNVKRLCTKTDVSYKAQS